MGQEITVVDAFTERPFAGNPAAVCVLENAADEAWMRAVAREMNLSETAFLHPEADGFRLRWLTPAVEVDLCGHATLASAHVLWESGILSPRSEARFHTRSGILTAVRSGTRIVLDLPASFVEPCPIPPGLAQALGATPLSVGKSRFDYVCELGSDAEVRELAPDHRALRELPLRGVSVTAPAADAPFDFVSRFFAPGSGVDEDPVTGSAHCALGPFWGERLGKTELIAYQASPRGGTVHIALHGPRVRLGGHAVTVSHCEILGPDRLA
jgi:predicted PhzF superfamily epimerase YddE/YHI9